MASALYVTYEQHQDQNFISRKYSFDMRKTSKGVYASDYAAPADYTLETTGDSEGFRGHRAFGRSGSFAPRVEVDKSGSYGGYGASSRIDLEPTPSEDSCTPKRKSISLNVERNEGFNVPVQVYAISVMSGTERRELGKRFKVELEQVRSMRRRIETRVINAVAVSSSSDLPSFGSGHENSRLENGRVNGGNLNTLSIQIPPPGNLSGKDKKRTPKAVQLYGSSEFVSPKDKPAASQLEKQKSKAMAVIGVKRSHSGKLNGREEKKPKESHPVQQPKADPIIMKQCGTILRRLMLHKHGWVFNTPVDIVKLEIPDYPKVIKKPMDLGTVKKRLDANFYSDPRDFGADVRLTFANARKYNPPGNDVHIMAVQLSELFESKWKFFEKKLAEVATPSCFMNKVAQTNLLPKQPNHQQQQQQQQQQPTHDKVTEKPKQSNKPKAAPAPLEHKPKLEPNKRPISMEEKQKLSRDLESFIDMPDLIVDFLRKHSDLSQSEDEIEIDIDAFDNDTLLDLRKLVSNCLNSRNQHFAAKNLPKVEPAEVELANGVRQDTSSPVYNRKGGDPGEEDVDIGENDLPASNYPPVVIEKDTAGRNSKCSSSSSSSSDSGSSSSDSDSASSSGSDSEPPKAPSPNAVLKEPMGKGAECNQRASPSVETHGAVSELDEENVNSKPTSAIETECHQEGESAPSERQVSPDKLYRAALLRSRFADTILKAQEKTLNQGDRGDPEKLRREREELERRQREEKARLQAEAKAAELARLQAEAEAAAEAKRKLEIEREAARLALQQMEKTVEIDENSQILKDLEMLRSSQQLDHVASSGDETSPGHSQDGLSSFPLHGGNPLEKLGLFMKMDDEEEEEAAHSAPAIGDVEEGEID
ncbi:hypothetical protein SUGI_0264390 [Cryptomeria japonica]|uniref:transcription factor GTE9 isoform X2 n=1 Tax=Cryptomeria japonica TaxID=3369 RepID=UPI002408946D|nr:transcription factor GTE9 isoform X2 [Cryptomeria japonica]GLJ15976.1 hypothetical protein SUGI_0264390 [Cryptomeria japonica]